MAFWLFVLSACTVDGTVIDDLPCECADGYVCDTSTNRCVVDMGGADSAVADAGADVGPDSGPDSGPDTGPGRDPDLGDCLDERQDDFSDAVYNDTLWGEVTDNDATVSLEDGEFVARVPANASGDYAFLFGHERFDLSECTTLIEFVSVSDDPDSATFFITRISNDGGHVGFDVVDGSLRAIVDTPDLPSGSIHEADYDPVAHRWVGLRGDGVDAIWIVSADGIVWNEFARGEPPVALTGLQTIFGVGSIRDNATALEARFDNINRLP